MRTTPAKAYFLVLPALLAALPGACLADEVRPITGRDRFAAHEANYALVNVMRNNGWAGNDEQAIRARYSFKYSVWSAANGLEWYVAYTGEFDFYLGTRPSGPVINRLSNPAAHVRYPVAWLGRASGDRASLDLGLEHRSDGQVIEVTTPRDAEVAQRAYAAQDRAFFDQVSRESNYLSLTGRAPRLAVLPELGLRVQIKKYLSQGSEVTWGPLAGSGRSVSDYDRVNLGLVYDAGGLGYFEAGWTVGDRGLRTDSFNLGWRAPWLGLPLYLRAHIGPMNTLSNYTQRQDSFGIGLRFETL